MRDDGDLSIIFQIVALAKRMRRPACRDFIGGVDHAEGRRSAAKPGELVNSVTQPKVSRR